jgi:DNA-binding CsgD family transcriptional regulator
MWCVSTPAAAACERIERLCAGDLTVKRLRELVLAEIRRVIAFDAHVWLMTDPVTRVGTSPLADVPGLAWPDLPRLGRWRYLTTLNRWAELMDAGTPVARLHERTAGDLTASALWRESQRELGVVDVAAIVFWDRHGCWAWLDLWRYTPAPPFTDRDARFLTQLWSPLTTGLRLAQARTFVPDQVPVPLEGPAVLVLDPDLQVRMQTSAAVETLYRLNPPDDPIPTIPAAAYNVAAALIAIEQHVPVGPAAWSRVHLGHGRWVTLRAARIGPTGAGEGDITVSIEASSPAERLDVFARAHALTTREREILEHLAHGEDTRTIAAHLVVSDHTVNDHVKAVLAKTGSTSRRTLLSRITGTT